MRTIPPNAPEPSQQTTRQPGRMLVYGALILFGMWIGSIVNPSPVAEAGVRKGKEPEAFKSGGERSEAVLRDITVILNRMDGRIAKIEGILVQAAKAYP